MGDHPRESVLHDVLTLIPLHDVLERESYSLPAGEIRETHFWSFGGGQKLIHLRRQRGSH